MTTTTFTATVNNTKIDGTLEQSDDSIQFCYDVADLPAAFPEHATTEDFDRDYTSSSAIATVVLKAFVEAGAPEWILEAGGMLDGSIEVLEYQGE